jgi:hypothetical protein
VGSNIGVLFAEYTNKRNKRYKGWKEASIQSPGTVALAWRPYYCTVWDIIPLLGCNTITNNQTKPRGDPSDLNEKLYFGLGVCRRKLGLKKLQEVVE